MGFYVFNWPNSVLGDWKDISIAHVIIIIKSEVYTFPIVSKFFRGCAPEMFVTSNSVTHCIYVPGKPGICFHNYGAVYDECKYSDTFWFADCTRLFVQYTISLPPLCKHTEGIEMPVRYILSSVWVRLSVLSPLSIIQYVGLYAFSLPVSLVMIERIHILCLIIIIKSEVWTITHCLGLGHKTMVSAICLFIFVCISLDIPYKYNVNVYIYIYIYKYMSADVCVLCEWFMWLQLFKNRLWGRGFLFETN